MTALIIIGVILLVLLGITVLLFLPLKVFISFKEEFFVKVKFAGVKLFEIPEPSPKKKSKKAKKEQSKVEEKGGLAVVDDAKKLFVKLKEKYGFLGAVKVIFAFLKETLSHIKPYFRHIKIKKIILNLTVASSDAATTAIEYGKVCSAVYPVLSFFDTFEQVYFRQINVGTDFQSQKPDFNFSLQVKVSIIYFIIMAFKVVFDYKKFIEEKVYERK